MIAAPHVGIFGRRKPDTGNATLQMAGMILDPPSPLLKAKPTVQNPLITAF